VSDLKKNRDVDSDINKQYSEYAEYQSRYSDPKVEKRYKRNFTLAIIILIILGILSGVYWYGSHHNWFDINKYQFKKPSIDDNTNGNYGLSQNTGGDQLTIQQIAQKVGPTIVGIETKRMVNDIFGFSLEEGAGAGSGIIIRDDGYIVTNSHVVENSTSLTVILSNGKSYEAKLIGKDSRSDIAVIKINGSNYPVAELGVSGELKVGDLAVAIGNPLGQEFAGTVTAGIISGLNRYITVENRQYNLIQTTAAINHGNSGGSLVNSQGRVIGINTVKIAAAGFEGLNFAIPIDDAKPIVEEIMKNGRVVGRPVIGLSGTRDVTEQIAKIYDLPVGVYIVKIQPYGSAERSGLKSGDTIIAINNQTVKTRIDLQKIINQFKAGDKVSVKIKRKVSNSKFDTLDIELILGEEN